MKLEDIGFYTLSDSRARNTSYLSSLKRCEMIVTDKCNFNCPYCRKLEPSLRGDIPFEIATKTLKIWRDNGIKNIRFSGGEPTLYKYLDELINYTKRKIKPERIALSTNGSADINFYCKLINYGVNDFSISLDACCQSEGDIMSGKKGYWNKVVDNIRQLSKYTYLTVGVVLNENNIKQVQDIIEFADNLGVSDIRVIPSAQYSKELCDIKVSKELIDRHPILKYRLEGKHRIRGVEKQDCHTCYLALDDIATCKVYHFPCIIYMREHGRPIGRINKDVRLQRREWVRFHNSFKDDICRNNCLDVYVEYNNRVNFLKGGKENE